MSEAIQSALIGLAGALVGAGLSTWAALFVYRRQARLTLEQARAQRLWPLLAETTSVCGEVLSSYAAREARSSGNQDILYHFGDKVERCVKRFYMTDNDLAHLGRELSAAMHKYLSDLRKYLSGTLSEDELEQSRLAARDRVASLLSIQSAGLEQGS